MTYIKKTITLDYDEYLVLEECLEAFKNEATFYKSKLKEIEEVGRHIVLYDDGSTIDLDSYAGGAAPNGAWSELSLLFTDTDGVITRRYYKEDK